MNDSDREVVKSILGKPQDEITTSIDENNRLLFRLNYHEAGLLNKDGRKWLFWSAEGRWDFGLLRHRKENGSAEERPKVKHQGFHMKKNWEWVTKWHGPGWDQKGQVALSGLQWAEKFIFLVGAIRPEIRGSSCSFTAILPQFADRPDISLCFGKIYAEGKMQYLSLDQRTIFSNRVLLQTLLAENVVKPFRNSSI